MKIVFVSNYFNHHQKPFSDAMHAITQGGFVFVETAVMREERKKLGYGQDTKPAYVKSTLLGEAEAQACQTLIDEAEVVIFGGAPYDMIAGRLETGKLTFKYSERIYKKTDCPWWKMLVHRVRFYRMYGKFQKLYFLSAGAFAASDYAKLGLFKGKAYKWGYFPETKKHDVSSLMSKKNDNEALKLLWAGRMIDWKHPEFAVKIAEKLKSDGIDFELDMIGNGIMEDELRDLIEEKGLSDCVHMLGSMRPEAVREHMESAEIFLFTSDRQEGWGAVLNEAMNSGCAVVASNAIGSVSYLLENGKNGLVYEDSNIREAYSCIKNLAESRELRCQLGISAYDTVSVLWNAELAALRLLKLSESMLEGAACSLYDNGPCSKIDGKGEKR